MQDFSRDIVPFEGFAWNAPLDFTISITNDCVGTIWLQLFKTGLKHFLVFQVKDDDLVQKTGIREIPFEQSVPRSSLNRKYLGIEIWLFPTVIRLGMDIVGAGP